MDGKISKEECSMVRFWEYIENSSEKNDKNNKKWRGLKSCSLTFVNLFAGGY